MLNLTLTVEMVLIHQAFLFFFSNFLHSCQDFNLTQDQLKNVFLVPHEVAFEPYLLGVIGA